ncbi:hypothetical protein DY000_02026241 [Brassica cretica]|uniref:SET domain-containing protein n=2 Tax=Brassica cretica TaxID=69181 RepID=A0ABQ7EKL8_BRACR|nr:hypothetical protein DY000_02026241 [Brassica cretica]
MFLHCDLIVCFITFRFLQAVGVLAKSTTFAKNPRQLQFEADINKLFMYTRLVWFYLALAVVLVSFQFLWNTSTSFRAHEKQWCASFNRLGREAVETDAEEIIEMAGKTSLSEQQKQVQENIHYQVGNFCSLMDGILSPDVTKNESGSQTATPPRRQSGLTFAVGGSNASPAADKPLVPETKPLKLSEVSQRLMDQLGYTLEIKPSVIPHKDAGQGCFIKGQADAGTVLAFYPGVIYSPAFYRYIPGYPKVDSQNSYLITRYDGTVINAQPWGLGGDSREVWTGSYTPAVKTDTKTTSENGSDRLWKALSKPLQGSGKAKEVLERRNPLAFGHLANHPAKETNPNVMICPYDFPLTEKDLRPYVPNVSFGDSGEVKMKRFGSFWFKTGGSNGLDAPVLKTLVLVATRALRDEELLLNYRLSNSKRRPDWYTPVNEEEDRRRWS